MHALEAYAHITSTMCTELHTYEQLIYIERVFIVCILSVDSGVNVQYIYACTL